MTTVHTEWITFKQGDQEVSLYTARLAQAKTPLPVVLVIQEVWGTDAHIQELTQRYAKAGYLAVAPDLYAQGGTRPPELDFLRVELAKQFLDTLPPQAWGNPQLREEALQQRPEPERSELTATVTTLFSGLTRGPEFLATLKATVDFLADYEHSKGQKIASVGFCMGGALSAALASQAPDLAGAIVYYGRLQNTDLAQTIQCPVLGFFGGHDHGVNELLPPFIRVMEEADKPFSYHVYADAHHAFFNDTRASYNVQASRDSFAKTIAFFHEVLL